MTSSRTPEPLQPSFEDLGRHLRTTTFCVVDLETTGAGSDAEITEIGAVKVCGGEPLGEFQTLVHPTGPIPAMIQVLTGITDAMVATAPSLANVVPDFLRFADGCVLVAHNAPFDIGFLKRACSRLGIRWPNPLVVDTVALARRVLAKGEVRNCKLGTLASHFHAAIRPDHRALSDAHATVDVLHALLERTGRLGVDTVEDLQELLSHVSPDRRAKRVWAKRLPEAPGIYWFEREGRDANGAPHTQVLYVGTSRNLRRRVASYFSAAEQRTRIHEMVRVATGVRGVECATELEAQVRELRMIAAHCPRYNRRSRNQHRLWWLRLTGGSPPRLVTTRTPPSDGLFWGPFHTLAAARDAARVFRDAFGVPECGHHRSSRESWAIPEPEGYETGVERLRNVWRGDVRELLGSLSPRMAELVAQESFEEAGELTDRLLAAHQTSRRFHRVRSLAGCPELVAAAPENDQWAVHVIRFGKLAGAARARTAQVPEIAEATRELSETVRKAPGGLPAGSFEEAERIADWLESPGVRFLDTVGDWVWPAHCALDQDRVTELITTGVVGRSRPSV
ncbi:DEDD exonuclease domain-containing protein [[Pseudopropionibacterium] massiliense]|uniref:DEDD exonuclease domain-containing protein n=1 Tax=[Pseudopropionibacterium] massiliense TaxID=2220000 RepID=UPI00102F8A16|nr:DEDD exonuclease domain-containing protein [[Pseudopropionibacterium] massiliense]